MAARDGVRDALAKRQAELARYLAAGGPAPAGFDEARIAAARDALAFKKQLEQRREANLRRPSLAARLWAAVRHLLRH